MNKIGEIPYSDIMQILRHTEAGQKAFMSITRGLREKGDRLQDRVDFLEEEVEYLNQKIEGRI